MPPEGGLWSSVKLLLANLLGVFHTRVELLALELEEAQVRFFRLLVLTVLGLFLLCLGFFLAVMTLAVLFWDNHRILALGLLALLFSCAGFGGLLWARSELRGIPRFLESTRAELARDRDSLGDGS